MQCKSTCSGNSTHSPAFLPQPGRNCKEANSWY